jgi:hypothetical protein
MQAQNAAKAVLLRRRALQRENFTLERGIEGNRMALAGTGRRSCQAFAQDAKSFFGNGFRIYFWKERKRL